MGADEWEGWVTGIQPGYRTKILRHGNATLKIHRPILTEAEAAERDKQIIAVLEQSLRAQRK